MEIAENSESDFESYVDKLEIENSNPDMNKSLSLYRLHSKIMEKAGPYIGPKGGKWADPEHTIPWKEPVGGSKQAAPEPDTKSTTSKKDEGSGSNPHKDLLDKLHETILAHKKEHDSSEEKPKSPKDKALASHANNHHLAENKAIDSFLKSPGAKKLQEEDTRNSDELFELLDNHPELSKNAVYIDFKEGAGEAEDGLEGEITSEPGDTPEKWYSSELLDKISKKLYGPDEDFSWAFMRSFDHGNVTSCKVGDKYYYTPAI